MSDAAIFASELEERSETYQPGDVFLLVTDGVTETRDSSGGEYGEGRLTAVIAGSALLTAQEIRDRVAESLAAFSGGCEPHDDQTIVVIMTS